MEGLLNKGQILHHLHEAKIQGSKCRRTRGCGAVSRPIPRSYRPPRNTFVPRKDHQRKKNGHITSTYGMVNGTVFEHESRLYCGGGSVFCLVIFLSTRSGCIASISPHALSLANATIRSILRYTAKEIHHGYTTLGTKMRNTGCDNCVRGVLPCATPYSEVAKKHHRDVGCSCSVWDVLPSARVLVEVRSLRYSFLLAFIPTYYTPTPSHRPTQHTLIWE